MIELRNLNTKIKKKGQYKEETEIKDQQHLSNILEKKIFNLNLPTPLDLLSSLKKIQGIKSKLNEETIRYMQKVFYKINVTFV